MAANNFYHSNIPNPPPYDRPSPSPSHYDPNPPIASAYSYSHHDDPSAPQHFRESTQSFMSDNGPYQTAGRVPGEGEHYADNIPLKAQTQFGNNPEFMQQQTQYPMSPGSSEERGRNGKPRRKGFFNKKPAWVTWFLTAAQIIVFIVELVKAGMYPIHLLRSMCINRLDALLTYLLAPPFIRSTDWHSNSNKTAMEPHAWPFNLCPDQHGSSI